MNDPNDPGRAEDAAAEPGADDPCGPPAEPVLAHCLHCGNDYMSSEMRYVVRESSGRGFWSCPTPGCGGIGWGIDIFPFDGAIEGPGGFIGGWFNDDGTRAPPPWVSGEW